MVPCEVFWVELRSFHGMNDIFFLPYVRKCRGEVMKQQDKIEVDGGILGEVKQFYYLGNILD